MFFLRFLQGAIMGAGGILPGISGGVLCVAFGLYRPIMELLTRPKTAFPQYWKMVLPALLGVLVGFVAGSAFVVLLFRSNETLATCLFIGLIFGTFPSLWKEAGVAGHPPKALAAGGISFLLFAAMLIYMQYGAFPQVEAGFGAFLFCGAFWGMSMIVPGLTSSSTLMAMGLFEPMTEGIAALQLSVLLPWFLGMAVIILSLSRLITKLFDRKTAIMHHVVCGFVLASTLTIIPIHYASLREGLLCLLVGVVGIVAGYFSSRLGSKDDE